MSKIQFVFALVAITASATAMAGATDKATGSGEWTNANGVSQYAEFNAHEALDNRPAKGHHYQETSLNGGGTLSLDVDEVYVYTESGRACYGGIAYSATGSLSAFQDRRWYVAVADGGAAGDETGMDKLRAGVVASGVTAPPSWCLNGDFGGNEFWSEGNVQIHAGKSHTD
jgi:hypothetical protein